FFYAAKISAGFKKSLFTLSWCLMACSKGM
ncbi:MAG: hypothetical protein ACI9CU_002053, partial [Polaribacter sp.]